MAGSVLFRHHVDNLQHKVNRGRFLRCPASFHALSFLLPFTRINVWTMATSFSAIRYEPSRRISPRFNRRHRPSQMYSWEGLASDVDLTPCSEARMPLEEKWYALTGRVVYAKVEADGDIHLALEDATGNRRCHRRVGAKVLTNLCQEWLRKFLEFLLSDRDRSRRWPQ